MNKSLTNVNSNISAEKRATRILTEISNQETHYKWTLKEEK